MQVHRKALGINQRDLATRLGVTHKTIGNWEKGTYPPPALFEKIAAALQIDLHEFTPAAPEGTYVVDEGPLNVVEGMLVAMFRRLPTRDRRRVFLFAENLERAAKLERGEEQPTTQSSAAEPAAVVDSKVTSIESARKPRREEEEETVHVRLLVDVAAGTPMHADRQPDEMAVPRRLIEGEMGIARARGESMKEIGIADRTLLLCRATMGGFRYQRGDVVVALVGDDESSAELTVKTFGGTHKGVTHLFPENPELEPIKRPATKVRIQGVVRYRLTPDGEWTEVPRQSIRGRIR